MKKSFINGCGICGMHVELNLADMFQVSIVNDEIKNVIVNHELCEKYNKTPYDQRKESYPEGQPKRIELSDELLNKLHTFINKLSYIMHSSTIFEEEEDNDDNKELKC